MRTYNLELIEYMRFFEKITGVKVKDCFLNDEFCFIIDKGQLRRAVGRDGINVKKLGKRFSRRIRIVEFDSNPCIFLMNLFLPLKVENVREEVGADGKRLVITTTDVQQKGKIFGRDRQNLKRVQDIIGKYFKVVVVIE